MQSCERVAAPTALFEHMTAHSVLAEIVWEGVHYFEVLKRYHEANQLLQVGVPARSKS
jgi:hypothetical protein